MSNLKYIVFSLGFFLVACGNSGTKGSSSNLPKDLNFPAQSTPEAYTDMVLYAINSSRGNVLSTQFANEINQADIKRNISTYTQAMRKKEWITEHLALVKKGDQFYKEFRWLDKRRRLGIKIGALISPKGKSFQLDELEFFSTMSALEDIKFK